MLIQWMLIVLIFKWDGLKSLTYHHLKLEFSEAVGSFPLAPQVLI